jgi:hypothetical protein
MADNKRADGTARRTAPRAAKTTYPELGRRVRQLLGGLSSRAAAAQAGISHATIVAMARGERVSMESVLKFARGFSADPNALLAAAGYPPLPDLAPPAPVARRPLLLAGRE